jgi:ABC-type multidrug transport system ATPase subunit
LHQFETPQGKSYLKTDEQGQIFGVLGSNGAGKSTLLSMILGFIKPSSGSVVISIDGIPYDTSVPRQVDIIRSNIGVCHQHDLLFDQLTPKEHLEFHLALKNSPLIDPSSYITQILSDVGLSAKSDSRTITLSGGQKRALSLAISLVGDPSILLLDEPTTGKNRR